MHFSKIVCLAFFDVSEPASFVDSVFCIFLMFLNHCFLYFLRFCMFFGFREMVENCFLHVYRKWLHRPTTPNLNHGDSIRIPSIQATGLGGVMVV